MDELPQLRFSNFAEWQAADRALLDARWALGEQMTRTLGGEGWSGYCPLCRQPTIFAVPSVAAGHAPNLREELHCRHCGTNSRCRAGMQLADEAVGGGNARVYATEAASPNFVWLQKRFPGAIGSEFEPDEEKRKPLTQYLVDLGGKGEVQFEDVTRLSFADASRDLVVSFDVLEHVPDYRQALREFARVLAPGGALVLTAPFVQDFEHTLVRARLAGDGTVEHLEPAEFHGDPLGDGVLCFYHFGWDLTDAAREAGFASAAMVLPWAPAYGLFSNLWTLVARR
jgi:SAM-dependent methyltransferase